MKDVQAAGEAFIPQKRTSSTLTWILLTFFVFLWVIFAFLDPDPDSRSWSNVLIESGSNPDPDRKHCLLPFVTPLCHPALAFFPLLKRMKDRFTTCRIWFFPVTDGHRVNCASTFTHAETVCWFERGEGGGLGAKSYYRKKAWSAIIIQ